MTDFSCVETITSAGSMMKPWILERSGSGSRAVPLHLHRALVLSQVLSGEFLFHDVFTGTSELLGPGDLMLAEPGSVLSGRLSARYRTLMIPLDPWAAEGSGSRGAFKVRDAKTVGLFETAVGGGGDGARAVDLLVGNWRRGVSASTFLPESRLQPQQRSSLEQARRLLESDLSARASLSEVARQVGWHPHHLQRLFRQRFGLSPAQYQRQLRVEQARVCLESGVPASEVAARFGFADQSHLIGSYRRFYGETPGARGAIVARIS